MSTTLQYNTSTQAQHALNQESQSAKAYPSRTIVHAKLEMTEPGDHDEQEADAVANTVVNGGKIARKISNGGGGSSGIAVSQQMESQLSQLQGGGRQMPEGLRNMMENGFGQDFSQVRIHTDSEAAYMSSSIHAKAFTLGNDIYFNQGQFSPNTAEGQRLVAHELTHVVQGTGKVGRSNNPNDNPEQIELMESIKNDFISKNTFSFDEDNGGEVTFRLKCLEESFFYQLLCTNIAWFRAFLEFSPFFFEWVVEAHLKSFRMLAQNNPTLFREFAFGITYIWDAIVLEMKKAKHEDAKYLHPRYHIIISDPYFHENGKDPDFTLDSEFYHVNRRGLLDEDYYIVKIDDIIPDLMNLNTADFLEFIHIHENLWWILTDFEYSPNLEQLWEHHISAFNYILKNDFEMFLKMFSPESLMYLGEKGAKLYKNHLDHLERINQSKLPQQKRSVSKSDSLGLDDALGYLGDIINLYSTKGNWSTFKELKALNSLTSTLKKALESLASNSSKLDHIVSWAGIALTIKDLYDTLQIMDFERFRVASSTVIVLKTVNLCCAIVSEPHFLKFLGTRFPKTTIGIIFLGAGFATGDLINSGAQKLFGKKPGEALVDLFMN